MCGSCMPSECLAVRSLESSHVACHCRLTSFQGVHSLHCHWFLQVQERFDVDIKPLPDSIDAEAYMNA